MRTDEGQTPTRRPPIVRWLGVVVGSMFLLAGVLEIVRVFRSGDGGFAFWFVTLVGGGVLVLLGTLGLRTRPMLALVVTWVGALAGSLATAWTVIVPGVALLLVVMHAITTFRMRADAT